MTRPIKGFVALDRRSGHVGKGGALMPIAILVAASNVAYAQSSGSAVGMTTDSVQTQSVSPTSTDLGEIVVTAQKRSERLIDVPISITVASEEQLKNSGISSSIDLGQITPGLSINNDVFQAVVTIRGIGGFAQSTGDESNVATYVDDVYHALPEANLYEFLDVQRIEVLKGPQGTLFGRNSTGGAIRIVSKEPSDTPTLDADVSYDFSRLGERTFSVYASTPVNDNISVSLSTFSDSDDSYIKALDGLRAGQDYGDEHDWGIRGKVSFKPTGMTKIVLAASYSANTNTGAQNVTDDRGITIDRLAPGYIVADQPYTSGLPGPLRQYVKQDDVSLTATQEIGGLTLKSISAYVGAYTTIVAPSPAAPDFYISVGIPRTSKAYSQEFNLSNGNQGPFSWVAGLYYFNNHETGALSVQVADPYGDPTGPLIEGYNNSTTTNAYAGFLDGTYRPIEHVEVTGGVRYNKERRTVAYDPLGAVGYAGRDEFDATTYRTIGKYKFTESANIYVSFSTGFKSGIFNSDAPILNAVAPEKVHALEIGAKGQLNGFYVSAAGFQNHYSEIQVAANSVSPDGAVLSLENNAASATVRGLEAEVSGPLPLVDRLTFSAGLSYIPTAKYDKYDTATVYIPNSNLAGAAQYNDYDASGSRIVNTPKTQLDLAVAYTAPLLGGEAKATAQYSYNSGFFFQPGNLADQPSYNILNARVAWKDPTDHYTIGAFAKNLTDAAYRVNDNILSGAWLSGYNRPRQVGIDLSVHF